jgi:hypothetical protein
MPGFGEAAEKDGFIHGQKQRLSVEGDVDSTFGGGGTRIIASEGAMNRGALRKSDGSGRASGRTKELRIRCHLCYRCVYNAKTMSNLCEKTFTGKNGRRITGQERTSSCILVMCIVQLVLQTIHIVFTTRMCQLLPVKKYRQPIHNSSGRKEWKHARSTRTAQRGSSFVVTNQC